MLLKARDDLGIDLSASLMVGDRETDLLAALRAGVPTRCLFVHSGQVGDSTDPTMIDATQSCATHRIIDLRQAIPLCCPNAGA
jgi:D-glycero-D-manno-heptose 1,7-bisphosphate phosphatase